MPPRWSHLAASSASRRRSTRYTVKVPARRSGAGATRKLVPRSKEELEKLRHIVQSALGVVGASDGSTKDEIALEEAHQLVAFEVATLMLCIAALHRDLSSFVDQGHMSEDISRAGL